MSIGKSFSKGKMGVLPTFMCTFGPEKNSYFRHHVIFGPPLFGGDKNFFSQTKKIFYRCKIFFSDEKNFCLSMSLNFFYGAHNFFITNFFL